VAKPEELPYVQLPATLVEDCCAKDDVRAYLNYPYLDLSTKKQPVLVATNGHYLLAVDVSVYGTVEQGWFPLEAIKRVRTAWKKGKTSLYPPRLYVDGNMCGTGDVMFKRPDRGALKFPDWRNLIPKLKESMKPDIAFNANYLLQVQNALCFGQSKQSQGCKIFMQRVSGKGIDAGAAFTVQPISSRDEHVQAVIMPQRFDE